MADQEVLKEFLVSLGYKADEAQNRKFNDFLTGATKQITAFAAAAAAAATAVQAAVVSMSSSLEGLYYVSQRANAAAENVKAFGFAVGQMGGSVQGAIGSLEALGARLRWNPGYTSFIQSMGVQTRQANGELRDTTDILRDLGAQFRQMPPHVAKARADALGIDERTLMALMSGTGQFSSRFSGIYRAMGVNLDAATRSAAALMNQFRELGAVFQALGTKIVSGVSRQITDDIDRLRRWIVNNANTITYAVNWVVQAVVGFGKVVGQVVSRVGQFFNFLIATYEKLTPRSKELAAGFAIVGSAFLAFNALLAASPVGRIVALGAALVALYDDFLTWREGGEHLIPWDKWKPQIEAVIDAFRTIGGWIDSAVGKTIGWENALTVLLAFVTGRFAIGMVAAFARIGTAGLLGLLGPIAKLPAGVLRMLGLGSIAGMVAGLVIPSGSGETAEHTSQQPGADRIAGFNQRIAAGQGAVADQAMAHFMANGFNRDQAAALVAQIERESGFDPNAFNPGGGGEGAQGLLQWRGPRIRKFREMYGRDPRGAPIQQQLNFMLWELNNSHASTGRAIRGSANIGEAARIATERFVVPTLDPAEMAQQVRQRTAAALQIYGRNAPPPLPSPVLPDHHPDYAARLRQNFMPRITDIFGRAPAPGVSPSAGGAGVTVNQSTTITVPGAGNPTAVAGAVAAEQDRVNRDMIRNGQGATR